MRLGQSWPKNLKAKMTEPKKLKLLPILKHMHACEKALKWVKKNKFNTFREAWDNCPDIMWIDWLVMELTFGYHGQDKVLYREGEIIWDQAWKGNPGDDHEVKAASKRARKALAAYYAPHCDQVEKWIFDYAHLNNCAIEVRK